MVDFKALATSFTQAPTMPDARAVVDVLHQAPPNPSADIQAAIVGVSFDEAYQEAASFTGVAREWSMKHSTTNQKRVVDFGAGWGRICRFLLADTAPRDLYALDVDPAMTALTQVSLPGVQALTVDAMPPTLLEDGSIGMATAFSVFSHLSPAAHEAWAAEFARLLPPGGLVILTLLDQSFFDKVREATSWVADGETDHFAVSLSVLFSDVEQAAGEYDTGHAVFAVSGSGVLDAGFYGWAAMPKPYIEATWGAVGFDLVEWVPSGVLFPQAMICLRRRADPTALRTATRRARAMLASRRDA